MKSIWSNINMPDFPPLAGDTKTDVLVIGGGMAGLLTAHFLTQAGFRCIVVEAARIGLGVTQGTTAKVTSQHGLVYRKMIEKFGAETAGRYLEANEQAISAYRNLAQSVDCDWEEQDSIVYSTTDQGTLEAELEALQSLYYPAAMEQNLPLPFPTVGGIRFLNQGQLHPMKLLAGLSKEFQVYENTTVREVKDHFAITDHGVIFADSIIVATHFPFLNKHGSYFLKLYQQRSYVLALENALLFDGMYRDAAEGGLSFRHYGNILLLGGGGHRTGKSGGGWMELERRVQEFYQEAKVVRRWAAQDCMTLDGIPYIGQYSRNTPNLYAATGFNKWGMTGSMVAAQLLTDLVQRKQNPYAEIFSPSRSILHKQLGLNLVESTKNLLTPTVPRCPHLGCALKWNPQEHSWDCPCHGSRFEEDGSLINNPATGNLKKRT